MRTLLNAELIKLTTTRTAIGLAAGGAGVAALGAFSTITSGQPAELDRPCTSRRSSCSPRSTYRCSPWCWGSGDSPTSSATG